MMNSEIYSFYGWWQFSVCLFAFIALFAIWWSIGKKQNDFGQVWLALSVLCWSISGAFEVYFVATNTTSEVIVDGWRSVWSLFNSLFILLALPWFRYLPEPIGHIIKSKYWIYIVGIPYELDVYYAIFTLGFLGYVLWESFLKRRLKALALLSLACILIVLVAQIYKLSGNSINLTLFSAIFKTSLIMIFFALALSWVKELSENVIPEAQQLRVIFEKNKLPNGKHQYIVFLKGFPGTDKRKIKLTPSMYALFLKFAHKKLDQDTWLEIKPKNNPSSQKMFDINDYNEVKRLLIALLDGLFGKENWTTNHHLNPLKNTLFEMSEKRDRKIRLAIPSSNISL